MRNRTTLLIVLLLLGLVFLSPGCKKKQPDVEPTPPTPPPVVTEEAPDEPVEITEDFQREEPVRVEIEPTIQEINDSGVLKTVYFGYDKYDLSDETRAVIQENVGWLNANSKHSVVIQGHCDERGTIEYNLALGERRARAVRDYMTDLGISASRVRIVSFGEERPAQQGHSEAAWSKNRRAQFLAE